MKTSFTQIFACVAVAILISQASALAFNYGDRVQCTANGVNIHSSATLSSTSIAQANLGDKGTVQGGPYYDSVSGYTFYYVAWDTHSAGYTVQTYLQIVSSVPATPTSPSPGTTSSPGPVQSSSTVTLSWGASSGATYYDVGVVDVASGAMVASGYPTATSFTATLTAGKTYRWNVAADNTAGESAFTTVLYFQTPGTIPPTPILSVAPANPSTQPSAAGSITFNVSNTGGGTMSYSASVSPAVSWLHILSGASGGNSGTIVVSYDQNTGAQHAGTIQVTASGASGSPVTLNITQSGPSSTTKIFGVDVSSCQQKAIDWSQVIQASVTDGGQSYPITFAYIRASKGKANLDNCEFQDPSFSTFAPSAVNAGVVVGAYHVAAVINPAGGTFSPDDEADYFVSVAGNYMKAGNLRPALDVEDSSACGNTPQSIGWPALSAWVDEWMQEVHRLTQVWPVIYCSDPYKSGLGTTLASKYDLWVADWTTGNPDTTPSTSPWTTSVLYQYFVHGNVSGMQGQTVCPGCCNTSSYVDMDVFQGTTAQFQSKMVISGGGTDITPPAIAITSPLNNAVVTSASLPVSGTASDSGLGNNGVSSVTVNGVSASGGTASGANTANWSAAITLSPGANTITVVAKDTLNNSSQQQITITYTPPSDATPTLSVTPANPQTVSAAAGTINYNVSNTGGGTMSYTASVTAGSWLQISSGASGGNSGTIMASYDQNTGAQRSGTIVVTASGASGSPATVTVTQVAPGGGLADFSGAVTDASTGSAISGATVMWGTYNTTTSSSGGYSFSGVPCQTATLTVSKSGYQAFSQSYTPSCSSSSVKNVALTPSTTGCTALPLSIGVLVVNGDHLTNLGNNRCQVSGHVTINGVLTVSQSVICDHVNNTVSLTGLVSISGNTDADFQNLLQANTTVVIDAQTGALSQLSLPNVAALLKIAGVSAKFTNLKIVGQGIEFDCKITVPELSLAPGSETAVSTDLAGLRVDGIAPYLHAQGTVNIHIENTYLAKSQFGLKTLDVNLEIPNKRFYGTLELSLPSGDTVLGYAEIKDSKLNSILFGWTTESSLVCFPTVVPTCIFLTELSGGFDHLSDGLPLTLEAGQLGDVGCSINIPGLGLAWGLPLAGLAEAHAVTLNGAGTWNTDWTLSLAGEAQIFNERFKVANACATYSPGNELLELDGKITIDNIVSLDGRFTTSFASNDGYFKGVAAGHINLPANHWAKTFLDIDTSEHLLGEAAFLGRITPVKKYLAGVRAAGDVPIIGRQSLSFQYDMITGQLNDTLDYELVALLESVAPAGSVRRQRTLIASLTGIQTNTIVISGNKGLNGMIVRLIHDTGVATFNLQRPNGTLITPQSADGVNIAYTQNPNGPESVYLIKSAENGSWQVEFDATGLGNWRVEFLTPNPAPSLMVNSPSANGVIAPSGQFSVNYTLTNVLTESQVRIYLDKDTQPGGGILMATLSSLDSPNVTLVATNVPAGTYYVEVECDLNNIIPLTAYAPGTISIQGADLTIGMSASPSTVKVGSNITYSVVVTNLGPLTASNVAVTDDLPADVAFVAASPGCTTNEGVVVCNCGVLLAGATTNVSIVVVPTRSIIITNTANVESNTSDPNHTNNLCQAFSSPIPCGDYSAQFMQVVQRNRTTKTGGSSWNLTGKLQITNSSGTNKPSDYVRFLLSKDQVFDSGDELIGRKRVGIVRAGKSTKLSFNHLFAHNTSGMFVLAVDGNDCLMAAEHLP